MIKKTFGPTTVFVCESTAHCSVHTPTDTLLNMVIDDIDKSNYVLDIVFDTKITAGRALQHRLGGNLTVDEDAFDKVVDSYS